MESLNLKICYNRAISNEKNSLYKYIGNRGLKIMRNFAKKLSAIALCTMFATMQVSFAAMDTGLGGGIGGAVIDSTQGGYAGMNGAGTGNVDLNFNGNAHVNWGSLNINKGESLNFNAIDGKNGLTVVNTVNGGMSQIYGNINANDGIAKLIISNPNGMLFDGAKFTTAGDLQLTTQALGVNYVNGNLDITNLNQTALGSITVQNTDFTVGGEFNITAPSIEIVKGVIKAENGLKLVTRNGQDFIAAPSTEDVYTEKGVRLETVSIDGNVYILSGEDVVKVVNGGTINGDLTIDSQGVVALNYANPDKNLLEVKGNLNAKTTGSSAGSITDKETGNYLGSMMYLAKAKVDGDVNLSNAGGVMEVGNLTTGGNVSLTTTTGVNDNIKHYVHIVGENNIGGNLNIDSIHNIHIGGYYFEEGQIATGKLNVAGTIDAFAREGSIGISSDITAQTIALESGTLNIITDGKATLAADEYSFIANGYVGGLDSSDKFIDSMEGYKLLPPTTLSLLYVDGGTITNLDTQYAAIGSKTNLDVTGVNADKVYLEAENDMRITGNDVHANQIRVGNKTDNLTVETASRDYDLKYTNIRDAQEIVINGKTEITYDMANGQNGLNVNENGRPNNTTYLVVDGGNQPGPGPDTDPLPNPEDNDNVKILNNLQRDQINAAIDANSVYTPVAFAADLDEEIDKGVRKNVDGSVTVVKTYAMGK